MKDAKLIARRTLLAASAFIVAPAWASPVSKAERIFEAVDALDVENHWPAGVHVNWKTGVPDGRPESGSGLHTHCSAFVASAAMRLGVYILRPPEHPQLLLANAQYDWLFSEGRSQGWRQLKDAAAAQASANQGEIVIAAYRNAKDNKPGHIAIVRPARERIGHGGLAELEVTQAGAMNYRRAPLTTGFAGHKQALRDNAIVFFAHAVDLASLP